MAAKAIKHRAWFWFAAAIAVVVAALAANTVTVDGRIRSAAPRDGGSLIDTGLVRANVRVDGSGRALVLIHGFAGAIDWWDAVVPALAADHRVVRLDLIGHGGTAAPAVGYLIKRQAALVAAVLDKLGIAKATLIGHSMGGDVATAFAEAYPDRVDGLVLIGSPPAATERYDILTSLYLTPVIGEALSHLRSDRAVRFGLAQGFAPGFQVPAGFVADVRRLTYNGFRLADRASVAFRRARPLNQRLADIRPVPPLLVIVGSLDPFVPPEGARQLAQVPGARLVTLDGVGHSPMVEAPADTITAIRNFLSGRPVGD